MITIRQLGEKSQSCQRCKECVNLYQILTAQVVHVDLQQLSRSPITELHFRCFRIIQCLPIQPP